MGTKTVVNEDVRLWSEDAGSPDGQPLLLIAGGNLTAKSWPDEFVALLVDHGMHVIRYDHRDTGRSTCRDFSEFPYTYDHLVRDTLAVLDAWDITSAHVVGMSLGHTIGQLLALDHPDRLRSLTVMLGGALDIDFDANIDRAVNGLPSIDGLPLPTTRFLEIMTLMSQEVDGPEAELDRRVEKWRLLNGEGIPFDANEFRRREQIAIAHSGTVRESINHHFVAQPPVSRGAELRTAMVPTLAIQAMCDPAAPPPHAHHLADLMPNARVVEIAQMGHALPREVHRPLADAIGAHIRASSAAAVATSAEPVKESSCASTPPTAN
ncbi:alpha/beta fold hydrolase [Nocardia asteroides]